MYDAKAPGNSQFTDRTDDVIIFPPTSDASSASTNAITMNRFALVNTIISPYVFYGQSSYDEDELTVA